MDSQVNVLMVAEKASIARSIAEALAGRGKYTPRQGLVKFCPIMTWQGDFQGQKATFNCTSIAGHIFSRDFPEQYNNWKSVDPVELFDAPTIRIPNSNSGQDIIKHLEKESVDCDYIVLWLDCDREGENICFEVLDVIQKNIRKNNTQQIFRAKFSSLVNEDLQKAFKDLKEEPKINESLAVDARQIIDLKVGVAFTRFQTKYLMRKYESLANNVISYGPCQTPTLGFCVQREIEIEKFKPEKVQIVKSDLQMPNQAVSIEHQTNEDVKKFFVDVQYAEIVKVQEVQLLEDPPVPLNTIKMLAAASKILQFNSNDTMQIAEKLYIQGFITYPRTETSRYSTSFDFISPLKAIEQTPTLKQFAQTVLNDGIKYCGQGKDLGDHPPITPTKKAPQEFENNEMRRLYDLIARQYMASLSGSAEYLVTTVEIKYKIKSFDFNGLRILNPGFTEFLPWMSRPEILIPQFKEKQRIPVKITVREELTKPPNNLSEEELINKMDENHIGTDASLASHINTIQTRKYVDIDESTRQLKSTQLGEVFIKGLKEIDEELCSPHLRGNMEQMLDQIALGKADYQTVLNEILGKFKEKYLKFVQNIAILEKHFDSVFKTVDNAIKDGPLFSVCGRCKNQMRLLQGKMSCEKCKQMFGLPKKVEYIRTEQFCKVDGFEIIICQGKETIKMCPMCNQKAWRESQKK